MNWKELANGLKNSIWFVSVKMMKSKEKLFLIKLIRTKARSKAKGLSQFYKSKNLEKIENKKIN